MKIKKSEHIVTAFAQTKFGPGWLNPLIIVVVKDAKGKYREECLQPEEQTKEMCILFKISKHVNDALVSQVKMLRDKR